MSTLTRDDIEIATRAADQFTRLYYSTYDSPARTIDLPKFYRPSSAITWNGNPFAGANGIRELLADTPITKHEVQCFDCHPIPGSQPPNLLVTVSGTVTHGNPPTVPSTNNAKSKNVDGQPRVFSQTFVLVPDPSAIPAKTGEVAKYYISADALRFVG
ncbi:NTF2-like protein [Thelephora terrestris]|uniref:NTF2-like protein n=1 Tax=Thelephora terrestris TaxID=56493 RepID=A0A9P6L7N5_9AGAM|nr:NTF2-like protein [Thelephora terrestris]